MDLVNKINPRKATKAAPGSQEKIDVLTARAAVGMPLFNVYDYVYEFMLHNTVGMRHERKLPGFKPFHPDVD